MGILRLLLFLWPLMAFAGVPRHQITFGNNLGVGWTTSSTIEDKTTFGIDEFEVETNNFSINYGYRFAERWQAGAAVALLSDEQEIKLNGGQIDTEVRQTHIFVFFTHNFHHKIEKAYYLTALFGRQHFEHASNDKRINVETDIEYDLTTYGLAFGKRFLIRRWDDAYITYSPYISYYYADAGGDFGHDGVESLKFLRFDLIRFDVLL